MNDLDLYAYEAMDRLHIIEVMIQESIVNHKYFDELASDEFRANVDAVMMLLADAYQMAGGDYDEGVEVVV